MITSTPQEQVVIRFTVTEGDHNYSDALYFTPTEEEKSAQLAALTEQQAALTAQIDVLNEAAGRG